LYPGYLDVPSCSADSPLLIPWPAIMQYITGWSVQHFKQKLELRNQNTPHNHTWKLYLIYQYRLCMSAHTNNKGNPWLTISLYAACRAAPRDEFVSCESRNFVGNWFRRYFTSSWLSAKFTNKLSGQGKNISAMKSAGGKKNLNCPRSSVIYNTIILWHKLNIIKAAS
jgi:hypothetical protein